MTEERPLSARRTPDWVIVALIALIAGVLGGAIGGVIEHHNDNGSDGVVNASVTIGGSGPGRAVEREPGSVAAVAARIVPSVVSIDVKTATGGDSGSGIVLSRSGYILTNNHVIASALDGQGNVSVTFNDGSTATARIVGADQQDDLAVIKVSRTGLPAATLGTASAMHVGDPVLALGSPLGLQGTVTSGIISALNRPVQTSDQSQQNPFGGNAGPITVIDAIQTDAAVNPGNSGGPLVNAVGQVIGINSAIASTTGSNVGVGFAIPIDQAKTVAEQLITTGKASHPLMGISLADATDSSGNPLARVQAVSSGGPAAKAGIRAGDIIVKVGDQTTAGSEAVIAAIRAHQPGDRVSVTVLRSGAKMTVTVVLANASDAQG